MMGSSLQSFSKRSLLWVGRRRTRSRAKRSGRRYNVKRRAIGPMAPGRSFKRRKRLVSRIWLDKVLAGEREGEI